MGGGQRGDRGGAEVGARGSAFSHARSRQGRATSALGAQSPRPPQPASAACPTTCQMRRTKTTGCGPSLRGRRRSTSAISSNGVAAARQLGCGGRAAAWWERGAAVCEGDNGALCWRRNGFWRRAHCSSPRPGQSAPPPNIARKPLPNRSSNRSSHKLVRVPPWPPW